MPLNECEGEESEADEERGLELSQRRVGVAEGRKRLMGVN